MTEKKKIFVRKVLWRTAIALACTFAAVAFVAFANYMVRAYTTVSEMKLEYNPKTCAVVVRNVYRDGHTKVIKKYTETSEQGVNPLCDALYAGTAAETTGYNPRELYESEQLFGAFEYNRGYYYGDGGNISREKKSSIMTVKFENGVTSWVDKSGVIASAWIKYGHDFDDSEVYVAFYRDA